MIDLLDSGLLSIEFSVILFLLLCGGFLRNLVEIVVWHYLVCSPCFRKHSGFIYCYYYYAEKIKFSSQLLLMLTSTLWSIHGIRRHFLGVWRSARTWEALAVCIIILRTAAGVYSCELRRHNRPQKLVSQSWTLALSVKIAIWPTVLSLHSHNYWHSLLLPLKPWQMRCPSSSAHN